MCPLLKKSSYSFGHFPFHFVEATVCVFFSTFSFVVLELPVSMKPPSIAKLSIPHLQCVRIGHRIGHFFFTILLFRESWHTPGLNRNIPYHFLQWVHSACPQNMDEVYVDFVNRYTIHLFSYHSRLDKIWNNREDLLL